VIVNELAQWAVLLFLAVFVLGLTRQLGRFLAAPAAAAGTPPVPPPQPGAPLPPSLLDARQHAALQRAIADSGAGFGLVAVVSEGCSGCDALLDAVERGDRPEAAALAALSWVSSAEHNARLHEVFDLVVEDPLGERSRAAGISATPFAIVIDASMNVLAAQHGASLRAVAEAGRASMSAGRSHNGSRAVGDHTGRSP
jgi:hypothetical protein